MGFVPVLDFFGDFVFLEHRRNGQTVIKTIFARAYRCVGRLCRFKRNFQATPSVNRRKQDTRF